MNNNFLFFYQSNLFFKKPPIAESYQPMPSSHTGSGREEGDNTSSARQGHRGHMSFFS